MAIIVPRMALALRTPNCTFYRAHGGATLADGALLVPYPTSGGTMATSIVPYSDRTADLQGQMLCQRVDVASSTNGVSFWGILYGPWGPRGYMCAASSMKVWAACCIKNTNWPSGSGGSLYLTWLDANGVWLQNSSIGSWIDQPADWTVQFKNATVTPPAGAAFVRARLEMRSQNTTPTQNLVSWIGCGIWTDAAAYYDWPEFPANVENPCARTAPATEIDESRFGQPHEISFAFDGASDALVQNLRYAYNACQGRAFASGIAGPQSGRWALMLRSGRQDMPAIGMYDFLDPEFPLKPDPDVPLDVETRWSGRLRLREII